MLYSLYVKNYNEHKFKESKALHKKFQETLLLEPMFEVPGSQISGVHVTKDYVLGHSGPVYIRSTPVTDAATEEEDIKRSIRAKQ